MVATRTGLIPFTSRSTHKYEGQEKLGGESMMRLNQHAQQNRVDRGLGSVAKDLPFSFNNIREQQ